MLSKTAAGLVLIALVGVAWAAEQSASAPAPASGPTAPAAVRQVKIVSDQVADCSTLKSIAESVTRGCATNDEKAIAIYNFLLITNFHRPYPSEKGGIAVLKEINVYGWSLCGGLHAAQSALWRELGWNWRFIGWSNPGHTTVEAQYDGKWHYLDVFLKFYAWRPDASAPGGRTIASQDDLKKDQQGLLLGAFTLHKGRNVYYAKDNQYELVDGKANWTAPAFLVGGDEIGGIVTGLKSSNRSGAAEGWGGINHATGDYSTDLDLAPGFSLTNTWELIEGGFFWGAEKAPPSSTSKDYRNSSVSGPIMEPYIVPGNDRRTIASGRLRFAPDFGSEAVLKSFAAQDNVKYQGGRLVPADPAKPGSVTVRLAAPYILCQAAGSAEGADSVEVSADGGKTFKAVELKDFSAAVRGQYGVLVRVGFKQALSALTLEAVVQNNKYAMPYLVPGKNVLTVSVADPRQLGENNVVVTYAYHTGSRDKSWEELCAQGKEVGKAHSAAWSAAPTVVQRVLAAKDLPARIEIDVPTPKGKFPVYPKMVFIRREVLAPGAKPLPLPEGAAEPKLGPDDELKTLPKPYQVGSAPPPKATTKPAAS